MSLPPMVLPRPDCPPLATLAAFVDGRLAGSERAAVIEHLADCDACREVVAEARGLADEADEGAPAGAEVVPFRPPARGARRALLAAAAAALVLAVGGVAWWQSRGSSVERTLAALSRETDLAARLGEGWTEPLWSVTRGEGPLVSEPARAFRLGVRSADLELALAAGDLRAARRAAAEGALLVGDVPLADPIAHVYREIARRAAEPGAPLAELARDATTAAELTREAVDPAYWQLGRWSETGRLAAAAGLHVGPARPPELPAGLPGDFAAAVDAAARPELDASPADRADAFARVVARGGDLR